MNDNEPIQRAFIVDETVLAKYTRKVRRKSTAKVIGSKRERLPRQSRLQTNVVRNCDTCGLYRHCKSPKMAPYGKGKLGIAIIGESPGETEDEAGRPFVGPSGQFLSQSLQSLGINLIRDCYILNAFQCKPIAGQKKPAVLVQHMLACNTRIKQQLAEFKPRLIITLGALAAQAVLTPPFTLAAYQVRGVSFPSQSYSCWVAGCWHPSYILRKEKIEESGDYGEETEGDLQALFVDDLARALSFIDKQVPKPLERGKAEILTEKEAIEKALQQIYRENKPTSIDYETSALYPYGDDPKIWTIAFTNTTEKAYVIPFHHSGMSEEHREFVTVKWREFLQSDVPKVVQNFSMEHRWSNVVLKSNIKALVNDTMVTAHIIDSRKKTHGLKYLAFRYFGDLYAELAGDITRLDALPLQQLAEYNSLDARYTIALHQIQMKEIEQTSLLEAQQFFTSCIPSLAEAEMVGMKVDLKTLDDQSADAEQHMKLVVKQLEEIGAIDKFRKVKGKSKFNLKSPKDVSFLLYNVYKAPIPYWEQGKTQPSVDKSAVGWILENCRDKYVEEILDKIQSYNTYSGKAKFCKMFKEAIYPDGLIHTGFLLHVPESYRSSSEGPNLQNMPKRKEEQAEFRKVVIPRIGVKLIESDAAGSEVATIAMLSRDPVLTKEIQDGIDTHRHWASMLWQVDEDKVTKHQRYMAKNKFVFPEFYGSWYQAVANDTKLDIDQVKFVEKKFWQRYSYVKEWQNKLLSEYKKKGYVSFPLGFRRYEPLSRNQIFNTPVQGTSFHMLLRSFRDSSKDFDREQLKSRIFLEVHDSIVADVIEDEREIVTRTLHNRMTENQWDWQGDVPRRCEISIGDNWKEMKEVNVI